MKYLAAALAMLFLLAAAPAELADEIATTGYHVDRNASATNECVSGSVSDARNAGGNMYIVVLAEEPPGGATTFSEATLNELDVTGTVFTVSPESIGYRDTEGFWSVAEFDRALDEANTVASDNDVVRTFVNTLADDDAVCSTTDIAGKSSWGFIAFVVIVVGGIAFLIWRSSRSGKRRKAAALDEAKAPIERQINDIANDILELEDEVKQAANPEATAHFNEATASFTTAQDRLATASTSPALLDLGYDLDVTIWHLDCAEAILDGNTVPAKPTKPEPPKLTQPPPPPGPATADVSRSSGQDAARNIPTDLPDSLPEYQRRNQRRSQYGSEGLMTALLAMQAMKGVGGTFGGGFGGGQGTGGAGSGRGSGSKPSSKPPRSKGSRGGRRRG